MWARPASHKDTAHVRRRQAIAYLVARLRDFLHRHVSYKYHIFIIQIEANWVYHRVTETKDATQKETAMEERIKSLIEDSNLDTAIAALDGARGLSHRSRTVINLRDGIYVFDAEGMVRFTRIPAVTKHASVEQAEAYCRKPRSGDIYVQQMIADAAERKAEDGAGWGR